MDLEIRKYEHLNPEDAHSVRTILLAGIKQQETYGKVASEVWDGYYDKTWPLTEESLQGRPDFWWVAVEKGQVVAVLKFDPDYGKPIAIGPACIVTEMDVDEPHQDRGIGTCLLAHAERLALSLRRAMVLAVVPKNPAEQLYRRLGFKDYPNHDNSSLDSLVVLWKSLDLLGTGPERQET